MVLNQGLFETIAVGDVLSSKNYSLKKLIMSNRTHTNMFGEEKDSSRVFALVLRTKVRKGEEKITENSCTVTAAHLYHSFALHLSKIIILPPF